MVDRKDETQKIQLLHPQGKKLARIDVEKYQQIKQAIVTVLDNKELTQLELMSGVEQMLRGKFYGSIGWYAEGVKLDLEARKVVARVGARPQRYILVDKKGHKS